MKEYKYPLLIGLVILASGFYWFQLRPAQIREECMSMAQQGISPDTAKRDGFSVNKFLAENGGLSNEKVNELYTSCIRSKGLEK